MENLETHHSLKAREYQLADPNLTWARASMWKSQRDKKFNFRNFLQIDELIQTHFILFRIGTPIKGCGLKDATKAFFVYPNFLIIFLYIWAKQYRGLMA